MMDARSAAAFRVLHEQHKLLVPSGTLVHDSCGEMFSPTQLGLVVRLLATFRGMSCRL
jgi:hypothetical protein